MGVHIKLPPRKCDDCNYHASGGAFKKEFGKWFYGKEKCPKCGSHNIGNMKRPKISPPKGIKL